jgi:hypothetical protein
MNAQQPDKYARQRSLKTFIQFAQLNPGLDTSSDAILDETLTSSTSPIARIIYRKIQRLHSEILNSQNADPVVKLMSEQAVSIGSLLLLVLSQSDASLANIARAGE